MLFYRLLNQWVLQPLKDVELIRERHCIVGVFVNNSLMRRTVRDILATRVVDLVRLCGKFNRKFVFQLMIIWQNQKHNSS